MISITKMCTNKHAYIHKHVSYFALPHTYVHTYTHTYIQVVYTYIHMAVAVYAQNFFAGILYAVEAV